MRKKSCFLEMVGAVTDEEINYYVEGERLNALNSMSLESYENFYEWSYVNHVIDKDTFNNFVNLPYNEKLRLYVNEILANKKTSRKAKIRAKKRAEI